MARANFFRGRVAPLEQRDRFKSRRGSFTMPTGQDLVAAQLRTGQRDDIQPLIDALIGTPSDPLGLSSKSPQDFLLEDVGKDQGLIPGTATNIGNALQALVEAGASGVDIAENLVRIFDVPADLGGAAEGVGEFLFGAGEETTEGQTVSNALTDQAQQVTQQIKEVSEQGEFIEGLLQDPEKRLSAEEQEIVETAREATAAELRRLQTELNKLQGRTEQQNAILDLEERLLFGDQGLLPGMSEEEAQRINEALDLATSGEAGLQPEVLEAVDAIVSSNLDRAGKLERLDFVFDQAEIKQNVLDTIGNVVQNRRDLDKLMELSGPELLEQMEIPYELTQPQFNFGLQLDPIDRQASAIGETVEEYWGTEVGGPIPPELELQIAQWTANEMQTPGWLATPAGQTAITTVMSGYPEIKNVEGVIHAIQDGFVAGQARNQVWDEALTYTSFEPGSEALAIALTQKALELGFTPEEASRLAESQDLHRLIQVKSGGNVGWTSDNGTQATIGGLSVDAIERVMGVPAEEVIGDTEREIEALIRYVSEFGNPRQAMQYYLRTGDWGS